jgi:hypothetical protein
MHWLKSISSLGCNSWKCCCLSLSLLLKRYIFMVNDINQLRKLFSSYFRDHVSVSMTDGYRATSRVYLDGLSKCIKPCVFFDQVLNTSRFPVVTGYMQGS